jgi:indolepyruvate ferredoxin oxidoreductase
MGEAKVRYQIHPPILRALGLRRKLSLGPWIEGVFRLLVAVRGLRGTALDPFGYARVRRVERALVAEYRGMVERTLRDLGPERHERAVRVARLPDLIRGYEDVKLRSVRRFREEARALGAEA